MSYRSERFNNAMRSTDYSDIDPAKNRNSSDGGLGVERMLDAIDYDDAKEEARERAIRAERAERLFVAEMQLVEAGLRHLIPVLLLIVENGTDFRESIGRMSPSSKSRNAARKKYFEHRALLLAFFAP